MKSKPGKKVGGRQFDRSSQESIYSSLYLTIRDENLPTLQVKDCQLSAPSLVALAHDSPESLGVPVSVVAFIGNKRPNAIIPTRLPMFIEISSSCDFRMLLSVRIVFIVIDIESLV